MMLKQLLEQVLATSLLEDTGANSEALVMDFTVRIWDGNFTELLPNTNAGIYNPNGVFDSSYKNVGGHNKAAWTLLPTTNHPQGREFFYAEAYNFVADAENVLWAPQATDGLIRVTTNSNKPVPEKMWLSCGDQSVCMIPEPNIPKAWYWKFNEVCQVGGGNISLVIQQLKLDPNVLQMTLQPIDGDQGYRSAAICLGFQTYKTAGAVIIRASDVQTWVQKNQHALSVNPTGTYGTWIGGLAAYLLYQQFDLTQDYHLEIDAEISEGGCLSCAIATDKADPPNDLKVNLGALLLQGAWSVSGTHRINGYKDGYSDNKTVGAERQIKCGLLDISTSYSPQQGRVAIDVAGPTFAYPGKRSKGTVQLNTLDMFAAGRETAGVNNRVKTLITNLKNYTPAKTRDSFGAVRVFDTKMIGGWWDASDGIETMGPNSYFDRNFIHTADDSIKLRAANVQYYNTTIWQGDTGAAINPTAYGYVNGGVNDCLANGVFIHRVTHVLRTYNHCGIDELMQDDDLGGLVSNRTGFSNFWFTADDKNDLTLGPVNIYNVYVPSLTNADNLNVNSIGRLFVLSAINPASNFCKATRARFLPRPNSQKYSIIINLAGCTWDFRKVNFATSFDQTHQYSAGAICTGNFNFQAGDKAFCDHIQYELDNGTQYEIYCEVHPPIIPR